jgi:hypothetical protein
MGIELVEEEEELWGLVRWGGRSGKTVNLEGLTVCFALPSSLPGCLACECGGIV